MEEILKNKNIKSNKEFEKLLSEDLDSRNLKEGTIITGTVTNVSTKHIFCDVFAKSEGIIPIEEWTLTKEKVPEIGSKIDVLLEKIEGRNLGPVVSREKARRAKSWKKMIKNFEEKKPIQARIISKTKGGWICDYDSVLAFLPGSQVDMRPTKNIDHLLKSEQTFEIVKVDERRGNIVLSRRSILERIRDIDKEKILSKLSEGMIVTAHTKNIVNFGCFVDLGGIDALIPTQEIAHSRIENISDILDINQEIKCKIIKIDESKKITCSLKAMFPDPWEKIGNYKIGKKYKCKIQKIFDYGAFCEILNDSGLSENLVGLIHSSKISWKKSNIHPSKVLATSQIVECLIHDIDHEKKRIALDLRGCTPNPYEEFKKRYKVNDIVKNCVTKAVVDYGIFGTFTDYDLDFFVHYKNLNYNEQASELKKFKKGMPLRVKILEINLDESRIRCGIRELEKDPYDFFMDKKLFDVVTLVVERSSENGIYVNAGNKKLSILIKRNQLAKEIQNCRPALFSKGNKIDALITELNKDKKSVSLSIKELEKKQEAENIKKFGSTASGALLGDLLRPLLKKKSKKKK